jgi:hypothetical protein
LNNEICRLTVALVTRQIKLHFHNRKIKDLQIVATDKAFSARHITMHFSVKTTDKAAFFLALTAPMIKVWQIWSSGELL